MIEYSGAGKAHLTQVHAVHPALSLVTSVDYMHLLQSALQPCCSQLCQPRRHFRLVLVAVCRSNMALGTLKVDRWPRKAGGRCIQCSFCVELSVQGKTVVKSRWSLKPGQRSPATGFTVYTTFMFSLSCADESTKDGIAPSAD